MVWGLYVDHFTSINTLAVGDLSKQQSGTGSTVLSIVQQVGIGFGIAISSIILNLYRHFLAQVMVYNRLLAILFNLITFAIALVWSLMKLHKNDGDHLRKMP